ncbi:MAG: hypothetical protein ACJAT7_003502 [Psychromonas sp.]|jgi:hypothetical protein|uniref:hypothetical protein n=1 Tax=Psychromonas sp. TaxID=1884585 RepID=UPI0039E650D8
MSEFDYQDDNNDFDDDDLDFIDSDDDFEEPTLEKIKRSKNQTRREIEIWLEDKRLRADTDNLLDDYNDDYDFNDRDIDYDFN